ncbi:eL43 family ribosomal protein [Halapricum hydrolyticum]|uniref:hypothetical protein n=1 Tax=Halapricum hydrolyticum TaxID=2979991 RepID=UPI0036F3532E
MMNERADFSCPSCNSSDVFRDSGSIFECRNCGERIHEAVGENADALERLSDRHDDAGAIARTLLETGGVSE